VIWKESSLIKRKPPQVIAHGPANPDDLGISRRGPVDEYGFSGHGDELAYISVIGFVDFYYIKVVEADAVLRVIASGHVVYLLYFCRRAASC
jgi:hypothetical protein